MINLHINNKIRIENCPPTHLGVIKKTLTLDNPKYYVAKNMGFSLWGLKPTIPYYEESGGQDLIVPRGIYDRLLRFFAKSRLPVITHANLVDLAINEDLKKTKPRDYQTELLNKTTELNTEGIIKMSTGSGKTFIALELIRRLNRTATILVHNNTLLEQWKKECEKFLGYTPGIMNGFEKNQKPITIATFQTLHNDERLLKQLSNKTSILIVDEVQGCVAKSRRSVLEAFRPTYLYGLTATPDREDGQGEAIQFLCGEIIGEYQATQLKPKVIIIENKSKIEIRANYASMIDNLVENEGRNRLINGLVWGELHQNKKILILTKRVKHYEILAQDFKTIEGVHQISSKNNERNELLYDFKKGTKDFHLIFGTTSLLAVGTDIPTLDTLIIACDMKSKILTEQSCGRILRLFEGKPNPIIYDIVDSQNGILWNQARERLKLYKKNGWGVEYTGNNYKINKMI